MQRVPRQARWLAPAGVAAAIALAVTGSAMGAAQAAPALAPRTPAELLAAAASSAAPPPMTGTVVETASLGIPQLPGMDRQSSVTSLLTGTHTIRVWYADPRHVRLALPVPMGETDLIRDGASAYLWQSASDSVTEYRLPAGGGESHPRQAPALPALTPQQAAERVLAAVGASTSVTATSDVTVAGRAAYQLVLAPKDPRSLIAEVRIALDGQHPQVPLQVEVFARGAATPAFRTGFTALSFAAPPASAFHFTPPPGAAVHQAGLGGAGQPPPVSGWTGYAPQGAGPAVTPGGPLLRGGVSGAPQVIGKGWLSVVVLPASVLSGLAQSDAAGAAAGGAARSLAGRGGGGVSGGAVLAGLLKTAQPVHGAWGSGKLIHTSLLNVLITSDGHLLAGAVAPSVLYTAVAQVK